MSLKCKCLATSEFGIAVGSLTVTLKFFLQTAIKLYLLSCSSLFDIEYSAHCIAFWLDPEIW